MSELQTSTHDPVQAPLWRKLLAVRVLLLAFAGVMLSGFVIDWLDSTKPDIPKWLEKGIVCLAATPFIAAFLLLVWGTVDLVVHFVPDGPIKRVLFRGGRSPEAIAEEFAATGYMIALLPLILVLGLLALALVLLLFVGGFAIMGKLLGAMFEGWPVSTVVIAVLIVAILLKKK